MDDMKLLEDLGFGPEVTEEHFEPLETTGNLHSTGLTTSVEDRALELLGSGIQPEAVAAALGVTASRISQLLSEESFAIKVATRRYEVLQSHNARDGKYNDLEDKLLEKLERNLALLIKPQDILKAITVINGAKRRGQSAPEQSSGHNNIVQLILPEAIAAKFTINVDNQVIQAGDQSLQTMQSSKLVNVLEESKQLTNKSDELAKSSTEGEYL